MCVCKLCVSFKYSVESGDVNEVLVVMLCWFLFFLLMIQPPPRSTQSRSSAASDVYKRQDWTLTIRDTPL